MKKKLLMVLGMVVFSLMVVLASAETADSQSQGGDTFDSLPSDIREIFAGADWAEYQIGQVSYNNSREACNWYDQYGYAAAISYVVFVIVALLTIVQRKMVGKENE